MKKYYHVPSKVSLTEVEVKASNGSIEIKIPVGNTSSYIYLNPQENNSWRIATCWGDTFDFLKDIRDDAIWRNIQNKLPVLAALINNGSNNRLDRGALLDVLDPEDNTQKWTIVVKVNYVDSTNLETLFASSSLLQGIQVLHTICNDVIAEMDNLQGLEAADDEDWRAFKKGFLGGVGKVAAFVFFGMLGIPGGE